MGGQGTVAGTRSQPCVLAPLERGLYNIWLITMGVYDSVFDSVLCEISFHGMSPSPPFLVNQHVFW